MSTRQTGHDTTSHIGAPTIALYEQGAPTFLKRWGARRKRPPALLLEWMAGLSRGAVLLDLGCGGGLDAEELRRKGYRVVGMDLTAAFLRTAREEAPLLPLVRADMRELPFRAASFDGVWAAASLIHLPKTDAARVLKVLGQIAGPGATLAATLTYGHVVDTHGHLNGSQALREVARTIRSLIKPPCFGVAYGGDEFVVVLTGFDKTRAKSKVEAIRAKMGRTTYLRESGHSVRLSASFGLASYPEDAQDIIGLLGRADKALFHIKQTGKGSIGTAS